MTELKPSEAQIATLEELPAETVSLTEDHLLAKKPDGLMVTINVDGEWAEVEETPPRPEPEVIEGTAEEIPGDPSEATPEEIEAAKPDPVSLAVDVRDPDDVFRAMDRNDEVLILDELQERALDTFVYSFSSGGKRMTDLTVAGVNETVRLMNERGGTQIGISDQPPVVDHETRGGEEYVRVMVFARDARQAGSGKWGTAVEPVNHQDEKRKGQWDKFAFTKALNKAQRNALKMQIPEDFRQTIIAQYLGTHHMRELKPLSVAGAGTAALVAETGPMLEGDTAEQLRQEITEGYRDLRKLNKLKFPPAKKGAFVRRAEGEGIEKLEGLRDLVQDWIEEEEKRLAAATEAKS